jgi:hypothetical protein
MDASKCHAGEKFAEHCRLIASNGQMAAELPRGQNDRQGQHNRCHRISVRSGGVLGLPGYDRGEQQEERNDTTVRERLVGCGGHSEPLVFDHEDGGPTIPLPAAATAAPVNVSVSIRAESTEANASRKRV